MGTSRTYPNDLGRRAAAARGYKGWSQNKLAGLLGIGRNALRELENDGLVGKDGRKTELVLHGIARETGLPYEFFTVNWDAVVETAARDALGGLTEAAAREAPDAETPEAPERRQERQDGRQG